jgi:hypothetical protein
MCRKISVREKNEATCDPGEPAFSLSNFSSSVFVCSSIAYHQLSRVLTLAASTYPTNVSKKILVGLYFESNFCLFLALILGQYSCFLFLTLRASPQKPKAKGNPDAP